MVARRAGRPRPGSRADDEDVLDSEEGGNGMRMPWIARVSAALLIRKVDVKTGGGTIAEFKAELMLRREPQRP